jgi:3-oxoacyl-[acyl-carrier-protein] synthase II
MIVVTGAGAVTGYGRGMEALHRGLVSGARHFTPWTELESLKSALWPVCHVPAEALLGERAHCSRSARLALVAAREALGALSEQERAATGIILGGTTGGMLATEACYLDGAAFDLAIARQHPVSEATEILAETLGLRGPKTTVISACSSGLNAVILARRWLEQGLCERVLAVGVDALCRLTVTGFAALSAIDAEGARPFQAGRKGLTIGEGAAAFVLEREASAHKRGRVPLMRLLGTAMSGEAFHPTQPEPTGRGARQAMRAALDDAKLAPSDVDLVSAHGTATPQNDAMEVKAILGVLGSDVLVTSQKSQLGHTLGAAGAIELAACVSMLVHQIAYPTYGLSPDNVDPECAPVRHVVELLPARLDVIMKNSFAFGGQNSVVVVGRA